MAVKFLNVYLMYLFIIVITGDAIAISHPNLRFERPMVDGEIFDESTHTMITDQHGFMWFSTNNGLLRYDGYTIKHFRHSSNNPSSISSNQVRAILEGKNGHLWIGTRGAGLNHFNPETEVFTRYLINNIKQVSIKSLYEDRAGIVWLSTYQHGLIQFEPSSGNFTQFANDEGNSHSISNNLVTQVLEDPKGNLWVATYGGLDYFDREKQVFVHYRSNENDTTSLSHNMVNALHYDRNGRLWVGTHKGLNQYIPTTKRFNHFYPEEESNHLLAGDNSIKSIHEDKFGQLWIGTLDGGLKLFDHHKKKFISYRHQKSSPYSILSNRINPRGIIEDKLGLLWIRADAGVNRLNLLAQRFKSFQHDENNPDSLSGSRVNAIYEDPSKQLWAGTHENGLNLFDERNNRFIKYRFDPNNPSSISSDRVFSILVDRDETLWVGTSKGLNRRDKNQIGFQRFRFDPDKFIGSDRIVGLLEDHQGLIWIATSNGLRQYNKKTGRFKLFSHDDSNPSSLASRSLTDLYEDSSQRLWVGTVAGLDLFDPETETFTHFKHNPISKNSLSSDGVKAIFQSQDAYLWIGGTSGLDRLDLKTQEFKHYKKEDGLGSDSVRQITEDDKGFLWITTDIGVSRFNPKTELFRNFFPEDGALGEFNSLAYGIKRNNGELVFGGFNGLLSLDPESFEQEFSDQSYAPSVVLTDFLVFNQSVPLLSSMSVDSKDSKTSNLKTGKENFHLEQSITHSKQITLSHHESMFSFEFAALDYLAPNKTQYAYQLLGVDQDWVTTPANKRFATYMNIPAGEYLFKVKAANKHGVWSDNVRTLKVIITPPFWLTWWAKTIFVLLVIGLLFTVYYLRTASLRRRTLKLEQTVTQRTLELAQEKKVVERLLSQKMQEFANVSHEFRTPLTLILGPIQSLLNANISGTKEKLEVVKRNGYRLLRMVDQLLQMEMFQMKQTTTRTPHAIQPIISFIAQSFQELMEAKQIQFTVGQVDNIGLLFTNDALEKILLNLLSNALKYTPEGGQISISAIRHDDQHVVITVQDTGIGIAEDKQAQVFERYQRVLNEHAEKITGAGIGLALVKELVQAHDGRIELDSQLGIGATFRIFLKYYTADNEVVKSSSETINTEMVELELESLYEQTRKSDNKNSDETEVVIESDKQVILVIEDNPDMREYISDSLSDNYQVILAANGQQGVELAIEKVPDFIISDVMMPEMNGYDVANTLKSNEITSHIPIILLTAKGDKISRIRGWKENIDDYLTKPFDAEELSIRVANLLAIRELLRHRFNQQLQDVESQPLPQVVALKSDDNNWASSEQQFIERFNQVLDKHIENPDLNVSTIAEILYMTERQLYRKLKALLNATPADYLRNHRLERASHLLKMGKTVGDVAFSVGFSSHSNFSRRFKAKYGTSPKEFITMTTPLVKKVNNV